MASGVWLPPWFGGSVGSMDGSDVGGSLVGAVVAGGCVVVAGGWVVVAGGCVVGRGCGCGTGRVAGGSSEGVGRVVVGAGWVVCCVGVDGSGEVESACSTSGRGHRNTAATTATAAPIAPAVTSHDGLFPRCSGA